MVFLGRKGKFRFYFTLEIWNHSQDPVLFFESQENIYSEEYLENLFKEDILQPFKRNENGNRSSRIDGKDAVLKALFVILASEQSFLRLELKPHREFYNTLVEFSERLGATYHLPKLNPDLGYDGLIELHQAIKKRDVKPGCFSFLFKPKKVFEDEEKYQHYLQYCTR